MPHNTERLQVANPETTILKVDSLSKDGYMLSGRETVRLSAEENLSDYAIETMQFGDINVTGEKLATIRMGGDEVFSELTILDIRNNPEVGVDAEGNTIRTIGTHNEQDISLSGDYVMVVPSVDGKNCMLRRLAPGFEWKVGREQRGFDNPVYLKETVSRDHCSVGVTEDRELFVKNNNPSNQTKILPALRTEHGERLKQPLTEAEAVALLSYSDVLDDNHGEQASAAEHVKNSESGQKYIRELVEMSQEYGASRLVGFASKLHDVYKQDMETLGLRSSKWGESISWVMWDLAKQRHLAKNPNESSSDYVLADPLQPEHAERKLNEIIDRHIGWEYAMASGTDEAARFKDSLTHQYSAVLDDTLSNAARNASGQLRSNELSKLGRRVRRIGPAYETVGVQLRRGRLPII